MTYLSSSCFGDSRGPGTWFTFANLNPPQGGLLFRHFKPKPWSTFANLIAVNIAVNIAVAAGYSWMYLKVWRRRRKFEDFGAKMKDFGVILSEIH